MQVQRLRKALKQDIALLDDWYCRYRFRMSFEEYRRLMKRARRSREGSRDKANK